MGESIQKGTRMLAPDNPIYTLNAHPNFDAIEMSHIEPALNARLHEAQAALDELEEKLKPSWDDLVSAVDEITIPLYRSWFWRT